MMHHNKQSGFALLIALIVVGVVIAIGLSMLDLSIKQVRLATNAKDSEIAFHAANAGLECAQYIRRVNAPIVENGDPITPSCFGVSVGNNTLASIPSEDVPGDGAAFKYDFDFTWGGGTRCTQVTMVVASSTVGGAGMAIDNMPTYVPGYPDSTTKVCGAGERCTVVSVQGYNRPCSTVGSFGTVQREVLLQF